MARGILFKAKRIDNGEWVEGYYVKSVEGNYIVVPNKEESIWGEGKIIEIDIDTLCQYTGLTDKNGNKIWENDVVFAGSNIVVTWNEYYASWSLTKEGWMYSHFFGESVDAKEDCVVIGNIFDNPELLGGDE